MITKNKIKERITCQRKAILDFLRSVKTHPTAEDVYRSVKGKLSQISRGTVYRNLKSLVRKGEVLEIFSKVSHYDGDISLHAHFICEKCNKVFDIDNICQDCQVIKRKRIKFGKIKSYNLIFYGLCQNCQKFKGRKFKN